MLVIESADQTNMVGPQHAIAEHIAGHVADADDAEIGGHGIETQLAAMSLHGNPGAARGDAHFLVVVADAAAGSESIAEPVVVMLRDLVGSIGEARSALVGGDDEISIVTVLAYHLRRRHYALVAEVVGEIEQAAHEGAVTGDALALHRIAI